MSCPSETSIRLGVKGHLPAGPGCRGDGFTHLPTHLALAPWRLYMPLPESPCPPSSGMYKQYPLSFSAPLWLLGWCLLSQAQLSCSLSGKHFPAWWGFPTALCRCFHGSAQSLLASIISCGLGCSMLPPPVIWTPRMSWVAPSLLFMRMTLVPSSVPAAKHALGQ